jgi:hypothetical protein
MGIHKGLYALKILVMIWAKEESTCMAEDRSGYRSSVRIDKGTFRAMSGV